MMAAGEWTGYADVSSHAEVVQAFYATCVGALDHRPPRHRRATRESMAMGEHAGVFLLVLGSANTFTARAVGLARGIVQREAAEMGLVGLGVERPVKGKRGKMADAGERLYQQRKAAAEPCGK